MKLEDARDASTVPAGLLVATALEVMIREETRIRVALPALTESPTEQARGLLRSAAALCELLHVAAVTVEQMGRSPARNSKEIFVSVRELTRLDVGKVFHENSSLLADMKQSSPSTESGLPKVVSAVQSILRDCPTEDFVRFGRILDAPEDAARIQVAVNALEAFVRRNDPWIDQRLQVLGEAYCAGHVTVAGVARILDVTVPDAVAMLEGNGYSRPIERVALSDTKRRELFAELDRDRLARDGKPDPAPAAIVRDVIASQRIEGIDARPWFEDKLK